MTVDFLKINNIFHSDSILLKTNRNKASVFFFFLVIIFIGDLKPEFGSEEKAITQNCN